MNRNLLIIGAGIYGVVAKEIAMSMNCFENISFLDDGAKEAPDGTPVIGTTKDLVHASICGDCVQVDCNATVAGYARVYEGTKVSSCTVYERK